MALWQLYAMRDALQGDSVIDLVLGHFTQGCEDGRGGFHDRVKRHSLQIRL